MGTLSIAQKTILESVLGMQGGFVLDFSNTSFGQFFDALGVDIFEEQYAENGTSKANRLRVFWRLADDAEVSAALIAFADYVEAKNAVQAGALDVSGEQIERVRGIAADLGMPVAISAPDSALGAEATAGSELRIEIHPDIRSHIQSYIAASDYFHAVEEAYKVVREKLRELTGEERATAIFNENALNERHYPKFFGDDPSPTQAERDFRRGVGYLHLGVQFLRNEKAHTLATDMEPNLAIHYVALASLAYDLVTRHVGEATVKEIEDLVVAKRRGYRSATAFYREFENGRWISSLVLPDCFKSVAVRKRLKAKWVEEADFTRSFDQSNIALMQLELVAGELTDDELDELMARPTKDSYGNDQQAGMVDFLEYVSSTRPGGLTATAKARLAALTVESSS